MSRQAIYFLLVFMALVPGPAAAACDWVVGQTIINNTNGGVYSTVNDLDVPKQDGIDAGHTAPTHPCGTIHYDTVTQSNFGTVAGWPAGYVAGDYALVKILVHDQDGLIRIQSQASIFYPATTSAPIPDTYQTLSGNHNYTVRSWVQFVDVVGSLDIAADANTSRLWESAFNTVAPTVVWQEPTQGDSETEIISADVDATDPTYSIFDVNGAVMVATNTADPGAGNFSGPSISTSAFTPGAMDSWTTTIDLDNDGDAEWVSGGHPINAMVYKICAWARNTPLQQSNTTCVNFTFTGAGGGGPSANGTGILRGTVFENETGIPATLGGVLVTLPEIGWATTTSDFGHFTFNNIPIGNYTIRLQKSGYVTQEFFQQWDHSDNDTFTGLILMDATAATGDILAPKSDEEIQTDLRTYVPFLFILGVFAFAWIVVVETFSAGRFK